MDVVGDLFPHDLVHFEITAELVFDVVVRDEFVADGKMYQHRLNHRIKSKSDD